MVVAAELQTEAMQAAAAILAVEKHAAFVDDARARDLSAVRLILVVTPLAAEPLGLRNLHLRRERRRDFEDASMRRRVDLAAVLAAAVGAEATVHACGEVAVGEDSR